MRHEQMKVYQQSLELVSLAKTTMKQLPTGYGFIADQLRRAVSSVPLNIAEGLGRRTPADQRRFFVIAKGSCCEVAAIYDIAYRFEVVSEQTHLDAKEHCNHIVAMLIRLAKR